MNAARKGRGGSGRLAVAWLLAVAVSAAPGGSPAAEPEVADTVREWRFRVTLDGSEIGEHTFRVREDPSRIEVESRASFDVKLLGFSLYRYEHRATERWRDGCLESLDASTDDNGTTQTVQGTLTPEGFRVARSGGTTDVLPACTMTFAYWNPAMRAQSRLLNPQTGEYLDVAIEEAGEGSDARLFQIRGKELEIALQYSTDGDRWLSLDSRTSRGGELSYRLR
jgi:hypothetical protein